MSAKDVRQRREDGAAIELAFCEHEIPHLGYRVLAAHRHIAMRLSGVAVLSSSSSYDVLTTSPTGEVPHEVKLKRKRACGDCYELEDYRLGALLALMCDYGRAFYTIFDAIDHRWVIAEALDLATSMHRQPRRLSTIYGGVWRVMDGWTWPTTLWQPIEEVLTP